MRQSCRKTLADIGDELAFRLMTDDTLREDFVAVLRQEEITRSLSAVARISAELPASRPAAVRTVRQQLASPVSSTRMAKQVDE